MKNDDLLDIRIISVSKSKTGKTGLLVAYPDKKSTAYRKGLVTLDVWIEGTELFEKIKDDEILAGEFVAVYHYEPGYKGQAYLKIDDIYDKNGISLLS